MSTLRYQRRATQKPTNGGKKKKESTRTMRRFCDHFFEFLVEPQTQPVDAKLPMSPDPAIDLICLPWRAAATEYNLATGMVARYGFFFCRKRGWRFAPRVLTPCTVIAKLRASQNVTNCVRRN